MKAAIVCVALTLTVGCGRKPFDATPEGAVREYLERMERVNGEPSDARAAFSLLTRASQMNLSERAFRASAATGKRMGPEQMIPPSHFFRRFEPRQWTTRIQGNRAVVDLMGLDAKTEHASIPCANEDGHWRIDLALPPLPPIERRPGSEPR